MSDEAQTLLQIARDALSAHLDGERYAIPPLGNAYERPRGAFVTWRNAGRLRGCIGHIFPTQASLPAEIAQLAVVAATEDARFQPITAAELGQLEVELSLLTVPEPTTEAELDAQRYGVIVTSGHHRGVLLPDLDGVDSPAQQIDICRRKARIPPTAPVTLQRFEVEKLG